MNRPTEWLTDPPSWQFSSTAVSPHTEDPHLTDLIPLRFDRSPERLWLARRAVLQGSMGHPCSGAIEEHSAIPSPARPKQKRACRNGIIQTPKVKFDASTVGTGPFISDNVHRSSSPLEPLERTILVRSMVPPGRTW